jgi:hypothetical protein
MAHPIRKHVMRLKGHQIKTSTGYHPYSKMSYAMKGVRKSLPSSSSSGGKACGEAVRHKRIKPLKFNF